MDSITRNEAGALAALNRPAGRRLRTVAALLIGIALLVAACGSAPEPAASPVVEAAASPVVEAAASPVVEPTPQPAPTAVSEEAAIAPSVTVADQEIVEDSVLIAEVVSDGPGWLVIHAQTDGKPGPILGYSAASDGVNTGVRVTIDISSATETLYAMLHIDDGQIGTWEFPNGPDTPVMVGDQIVTPAFRVSNQVAASPSASAPGTGSGIPAGAVVVEGDEAEVEMEDFRFSPQVLVIRPGTTVKFANKDRVQHTATSDTGVFDSGYLAKGEEYYYTFTEPGTYPYYCIPHGGPGGQGMAATIIVQP